MNALAITGGSPLRSEPFPTYPFYGPEAKQAVDRVFASQVFCSLIGGETAAFEQEYARWHDMPHAIGVSNGTTGLHLALAAAGIGPGDEVLVPAYTYIASAAAVVAANAVPVLVDSETTSHGLDPADMARKLTPHTRAVMPVHVNGYPCDMDAIMALAREHDLLVIEDCSHAHGATHRGRKVGTIGDVGVFSLQHKKNLSLGEAGIAITRDDALAERMAAMRTFGEMPMKYNYRMPEFHAAIGRSLLPQLKAMNATRQRNAERIFAGIEDIPGLSPHRGLPDTTSVFYNCIVCYQREVFGVPRRVFVEALKAEGIPINIFYYPLNRDPIMQARDAHGRGCPFACPHYRGEVRYERDDNPVATRLCDEVNIEFKVHPPCSERDMDDIVAAIRKVCDHADELAAIEVAP